MQSSLPLAGLLVGVALIATAAFLKGDGSTTKPRTRAELTEACAGEDGQACYDLGLQWGNGDGGPADHRQARRYVSRACELDVAEACDFLPMMR